MTTLLRHFETLRQVLSLPQADLHFDARIEPDDIAATYRYYTKPHPRYKLIRHKTIGAALIDLARYPAASAYVDALQGKNRGAWHARRARTRGYVCTEIDRNDYVDAIHAINTSLETRQGRAMDQRYLQKITRFERQPHFDYYGVLDSDGRLVAYANIGRYGNFSAFSQVIGLRNNDGIMHMLFVDIVLRLIERQCVRYVMYDTFFGAREGLQNFKRIVGFEPYRVRYSLQ
ncbi:hypothetical protein HAV22_23140 [Massilia sp. TW-1]|uniref:BioF2-like acetyltransferase domain-containing protein n=1 Tax=Telluria antibiotica TaxID=2717319 RepID=A0ABX0PGH5_9BURK|nr:hypothetical protein [Telluria antibiotica]NIA56527.1 hypothetical protein [Telluria antibiotica]